LKKVLDISVQTLNCVRFRALNHRF